MICNLPDTEEHKVGLLVDSLNVYGHSSCKMNTDVIS